MSIKKTWASLLRQPGCAGQERLHPSTVVRLWRIRYLQSAGGGFDILRTLDHVFSVVLRFTF